MILAAAVPVPRSSGGRRKPSPALMAGVAFSVLVHVAGGYYLYQQRFTLQQTEPSEPSPFVVQVWHPPVTPPPPPEHPVVRTATPPPVVFHTPLTPPLTPVDPVITPLVPPVAMASDIPAAVVPTPVDVAPVTPVAVAVEPPAPPAAPTVIDSPRWISQPTGAQLLGAYPRRALENEVAGSATLRCVVTATGAMSGCRVIGETPGGYGFGEAAMRLTRYFQISPRTVDGAPVDGAVVRIPMNFALSG